MKKFAIAGLVVTVLVGSSALRAQDMPKMPPPQKEHEWLKQFAGEWETDAVLYMEPGKPPVRAKGSDSSRMLGGFWLVSDGKAEMMGMPFTSVFTLGYDPQKKKYVGTWVDSMTSYLWKYEGTVDTAGKVLTLDTEGPCPTAPGKVSKFKDVLELKNKDHRTFSSSMQGEDGKWTTMVTVDFHRKK